MSVINLDLLNTFSKKEETFSHDLGGVINENVSRAFFFFCKYNDVTPILCVTSFQVTAQDLITVTNLRGTPQYFHLKIGSVL